MEIPKILNLGSGKDFREDCLNLDFEKRWDPDIVEDLNFPIIGGLFSKYPSKRFGKVKMVKNMFKEIIAHDVLEHILNLERCMKTCLDLLEEGGTMDILVPYDLSLGAWQDPTHVRAFNQNSWKYYNEWAWYLGWEREVLWVNSMVYNISDLGKDLIEEGKKVDEILSTPRAIDSMSVILKKKTLGG